MGDTGLVSCSDATISNALLISSSSISDVSSTYCCGVSGGGGVSDGGLLIGIMSSDLFLSQFRISRDNQIA